MPTDKAVPGCYALAINDDPPSRLRVRTDRVSVIALRAAPLPRMGAVPQLTCTWRPCVRELRLVVFVDS